MKRLAVVFPGQGSQHVGMGKFLSEHFPVARHVFEEVDEALKLNLSAMMFSGDSQELNQTENAQPALLANSIATLRVAEEEVGLSLDLPQCCTAFGHSLGEFTAMTASKVLPLFNSAQLVRHRGLAMRQAAVQYGSKEYAMAAIVPLSAENAKKVCELALASVSSSELEGNRAVCEVANINAPTQVVLSGTMPEIERAGDLAKKTFKSRLVKRLAVSAPFHSTVMEGAQPVLQTFLDDMPNQLFDDPVVPIISNVTAKPVVEGSMLRSLAVEQLTSTVQWVNSVQTAVEELQVDTFVEIGGNVTTGFTSKCLQSTLAKGRDLDARSLVLNNNGVKEQLALVKGLLDR